MILGTLQQLRDLAVVQRRVRLAVTELASAGNLSGAEELRAAEPSLGEFRARLLDALRRFALVPGDAPTACRCRSEPLPGEGLLRAQAITALATK